MNPPAALRCLLAAAALSLPSCVAPYIPPPPPPVVVGPARPVYVTPRPVYVTPRPVYVAPRPVYAAPRPVYVSPRPVYRPNHGYYHHPRRW